MRALVTGWFSFEQMGATSGDLLARDLACEWLREAGWEHDVAHAPPFRGGVDWRSVDASDYSLLVFVCGPFGENELVHDFLERFKHCRKVGLNLSMLQPLEEWNPFDLLLERDSSATSRPDITFLASGNRVPAVGVVLVHPQEEYKAKAMHDSANQAVHRLLGSRELAAVAIDTRLDLNATGLRTPGEVESLIARMDAVVTTRLHGTVAAIKNGVPPVVIDPIAGGAKVKRHADTIGWPVAFTADSLNDEELERALDFCLSAAGRAEAERCRQRAREAALRVRERFIAEQSRLGRAAKG